MRFSVLGAATIGASLPEVALTAREVRRSLRAAVRTGATILVFLTGVGCAAVSPHATADGGGGGVDTSGPTVDAGVVTVPTIDAPLDHVGVPADPDAGVCQRELRAVVRDFRSGEKDGQPKHPDFENKVAVDPGIVAALLGSDLKPVYAGGTQGTTTTKANFDQWYRDVPGINITFEKTIPLSPDPARAGVWVYDSDAFYPLGNDEGWGNQYLDHNQDFTTEIHVSFPYKGGEVFTFRGDDDSVPVRERPPGRRSGRRSRRADGHGRSGCARRRAGPAGRQDVSDGHLPGRTPLLPVDLPHRDDVVLHQQHHRRVIRGRVVRH